MIDFENLPTHPVIEQIVDDLVVITGQDARPYFRVKAGFYLSKVASCMHAMIDLATEKKPIPVNAFAIALAPSGFGKGKSVLALNDLVSGFRGRFMTDTFPVISDQNLWKLAIGKAAITGKTEDEEKAKYDSFFNDCGPLLFTVKAATAPTVQQFRSKILMSSIGAINLQVDEFGQNAEKMGVADALGVFFELYDMGVTELSATKNTKESARIDDLQGVSPANLLIFGEPTKVFDGASIEAHFMGLLTSGYARRCLYAWGEKKAAARKTPDQIYDERLAAAKASSISTLQTHMALLSDPARHKWMMEVPRYVELKRIAYQTLCEERAEAFPSTETIKRTEMEHRAFKALKLSGALAFIDESTEITEDHLMAAIGIVEDSGTALHRMLARDKAHVRLAKHIAEFAGELTHADLSELTFYPRGDGAQKQMLRDARAWGYKNNIVIQNRFEDGVELFSGDKLQETNLDEMIVSYSDDFAYNYQPEQAPWDALHLMTQAPDMNWCNHQFEKLHRSDENTIPGFNMVVFDYDGGVPIDIVHDLLSGYRFMTYTTKRHDPKGNHRFRLLLPINYVLKLDKPDYRTFVEGLSAWLPVPSSLDKDESPKQRSKKWLACPTGTYHYNEGELVDCLPFIPKTSRNDDHQKAMQQLQSLDNLERWFAQRMGPEGSGRNNEMIKFTLALVDAGLAYTEVENAVISFNDKIQHPMTLDELRGTVLVTAARKIAGKQAAAA